MTTISEQLKQREFKFRAWDGDDSVSHKDGEYTYVKADWHPYANKRGYVKKHRLVLEKKLGYYLPKKSIVHHINGNKRDDTEANLQIIPSQKIHAKEHDTSVRNKNGEFVATEPIFQEIKFRLYNKHTQQYEIYNLSKLIRTTFRNSQFTFAGRYTGLKDKNGKEIYEGDVVRDTFFTKDWRWEIYFDTEEGRFWARKPGEVLGEFNCPDDPAYPRWHDYEVIGNIYEHSHLLDNK